jgi:putative ABC transport system ATP-binding protein
MPSAPQHPKLDIQNLSRSIEGKTIVSQISFQVFSAEVVAVVGPSGSGKSSLLRLLNRLDEPSTGTVFLDGEDYKKLPPRVLRRRVGMIMQQTRLFPGTVADNIRFGPLQQGHTMPDAAVEQLLARVGLAGFGGRKVDKLSGGEAQRVAIARALANAPEVLLLDEPTSALDDDSKNIIEEMLAAIIRSEGLTCVWVTHDRAQAARMGDRIALLEAGRLTRIAPPQEAADA